MLHGVVFGSATESSLAHGLLEILSLCTMHRFSGVDFDVVIVGAGVAGSTSAHAIATQLSDAGVTNIVLSLISHRLQLN